MNPITVEVSTPATRSNQPPGRTGRAVCKALLVVGTLLSAGELVVQPADAADLLITTTGTITSGSETGDLFGLGTTASLVGDSYTLAVKFNSLGPNYFTTGPGTVAEDFESSPGVTGYVTATIDGQSVTTVLTNSLGSSLFEDVSGFEASNEGFNGAGTSGAFVSVLQDLSCSGTCVPNANLTTAFSYVLGALDSGTDLYTLQGAGFPAADTPTATFEGTETSLDFTVPEPASLVVLAAGLLGLSVLARRRRV